MVYVFILPNLFRLTRGKHTVFKHTHIPFSQNRLKYLKSDIFIVGMPKTGFTLRLLYDTQWWLYTIAVTKLHELYLFTRVSDFSAVFTSQNPLQPFASEFNRYLYYFSTFSSKYWRIEDYYKEFNWKKTLKRRRKLFVSRIFKVFIALWGLFS